MLARSRFTKSPTSSDWGSCFVLMEIKVSRPLELVIARTKGLACGESAIAQKS